jgi:hypothetical protein
MAAGAAITQNLLIHTFGEAAPLDGFARNVVAN